MISKFVFGTEQLGGVDWGDYEIDEVIHSLDVAWEKGVRIFDTAGIYGLGESEKRLGMFLENQTESFKVISKGGLQYSKDNSGRAKITKNSSPETLYSQVSESLERLKIDKIDVYLLHWWDERTVLKDIVDVFKQMVSDGKIAQWGFSNLPIAQLETVLGHDSSFSVQYSLNLLDLRFGKEIRLARNQGLEIFTYGALAQGLLTGKYSQNDTFSKNDRRHRLPLFDNSREDVQSQLAFIRLMSNDAHLTMTQLCLRYILGLPFISGVITGCKNVEQTIDNCAIYQEGELRLSQQKKVDEFLASVYGGERVFGDLYDK